MCHQCLLLAESEQQLCTNFFSKPSKSTAEIVSLNAIYYVDFFNLPCKTSTKVKNHIMTGSTVAC